MVDTETGVEVNFLEDTGVVTYESSHCIAFLARFQGVRQGVRQQTERKGHVRGDVLGEPVCCGLI